VDVDAASAGIGIIGMRERVHALGGTISFRSDRVDGTVVNIALPLRAPTAVS
ncbi:MAG: Histidine kinase, partial [Massilia sp.]|nr:Histidine kinase [Massilia sp.]